MDLNEKLARYLELKNNWVLAEKIREGNCFAYSVCYSSMALSKRLGWWESAITKIGAWDGEELSLNKSTYLKQALNPYETLDFLFQRIIDYVIFHQPMDAAKLIFKGMNQINFLQPGTQYFELNETGNTIKQCQNMIGYFTQEDLDLLLTPSLLQYDIALIGSRDHSCVIRYARNQWHFFDSNHSCAKAVMYKNKSEFIKRIFFELRGGLEIYFASLNKDASWDFTNYYSLLENKMGQLLNNKTFYFFACNGSDYLPLIFEQAKHNKLVRNQIMSCLNVSLEYIIHYAPHSLHALIMAFSQNRNEFDRFIKSMPAAIPNYKTSPTIRLIRLFIELSTTNNQLKVLLNIQKELNVALEYDSLKSIIEGKIMRATNGRLFVPSKHITAYKNEDMEVEEEGMDVERGWFVSWF